MQDLERLYSIELLKRFNSLDTEDGIHAFCNSNNGSTLFNILSQSPNYSDFKEFERIIPFYIDARISQNLAGVGSLEDLQSKNLGLKGLLGDDQSTRDLENKIKHDISSKMRDGKSAQESFKEIKKLNLWKKILEFLSIFTSVNAQLKNTTSEFVQKKLQDRKNELVSKIEDFDKNFETNDTGAEVSKSAHTVGIFKKGDKTVFVKDIGGIKAGFYGAITGVKNEGIRELFGAEFMREMGVTNAPQIELIEKKGKAKKIVSQKVGKEGDVVVSLGKQLGVPNGLKRLRTKEKNKFSESAAQFFEDSPVLKEQVMQIHAISYLMGNRDLHVNNIMVITDQEGKQSVAPIDFGLSGHDMKTVGFYVNRFNTENLRHSDTDILFTQQEYQSTFSSVLERFEKNKEGIMDRVLYQCRAAGASDIEISGLRANIEANLIASKRFLERQNQITR
jgi:hypothetical protein